MRQWLIKLKIFDQLKAENISLCVKIFSHTNVGSIIGKYGHFMGEAKIEVLSKYKETTKIF